MVEATTSATTSHNDQMQHERRSGFEINLNQITADEQDDDEDEEEVKYDDTNSLTTCNDIMNKTQKKRAIFAIGRPRSSKNSSYRGQRGIKICAVKNNAIAEENPYDIGSQAGEIRDLLFCSLRLICDVLVSKTPEPLLSTTHY